jgi:hypothetical protein
MAIEAERLNIILAARDREFAKAMDANARRVEKFANKSKKELSSTGKAFDMLGASMKGLAVGAAFAFTARAIDSATKMAVELTNISRVAGVSTTRFQELAFASKSFGVNQEKLSDILKDVNDKFGDYYTTGAGPLADFFENIAPKIGITADAFKGLSSSDALQLYVKSLEDANVSQAEMTFYMEALAGDATLLAPLFQNGGAALDEFSAAARSAGAVIDEDLIAKTVKLREKFDQAMTSMTSKLGEFVMKYVVGMAAIIDPQDDDKFDAAAKKRGEAFEDLIKKQQRLMKAQAFLADNPSTFGESQLPALKSAVTLAEAELAAADELVKTFGNLITSRAIANNATANTFSGTGGTGGNQKQIDELLKIVAAYEQLAGSLDPLIAAANEYAKAQATVNAAVAAGAITQDQANVTLEMAKQKFELATGSAVDLSSVYSTLASSMESSMMAMVDGTMSAKDAFKSMASAVIKELFRVLVVQQLVNAAMGVFGYAPTAGGGFAPKPSGNAAGGPVQAGVPTIAGEHGRELFVPQSNGRIMTVAQTKQMQGGGGGGVVVNQTINVTTGVQQTVRAEIKSLMPQIADNAKAAVLDAKRRGGSYGGGFA